MNERSSKFAVWMTILWLGGIFSFYIFGLFERPDSFNELGDFLAGIFAPVAFLWLIYGYFQNSEALKAQVNEMTDNVTQQTELVHVLNKQFLAWQYSKLPRIVIIGSQFTYLSSSEYDGFMVKVTLSLINLGGVAHNFNIYSDSNEVLFKLDKLNNMQEESLDIELFENDLETYNETNMICYIKIKYRNNINDETTSSKYQIFMKPDFDSFENDLCVVDRVDENKPLN